MREGASAEPRDGRAAPDDAAILRQIARGDLAGFEAFVGRYRARLTAYAYQRVGDLHRAEDIAPWLFAIARNQVTDYLRALDEKVLPLPADAAGVDLRPDACPEGDCPAGDLLANLPEAQRDVVALKVLCGLTFAQIGEVVGCPPATAKSRMRYGLGKLREALSRERRASHD